MFFGQPLSEKQALELGALNLAYVGDAVHTLYVRTSFAQLNNTLDVTHKLVSDELQASAQARLAKQLQDAFSPTELAVFLRGRNSPRHHRPKNQPSADYRQATGLEAVFGYLYLTGQIERLQELLQMGLCK